MYRMIAVRSDPFFRHITAFMKRCQLDIDPTLPEKQRIQQTKVVRTGRFELPTSCLSSKFCRKQYPETTPVIQNIFYLCTCPSGLTYQMKVFSLLSLYGNLENFKASRISKPFITLYGYWVYSAPVIIRVWGIVYLLQGFAEPPFR